MSTASTLLFLSLKLAPCYKEDSVNTDTIIQKYFQTAISMVIIKLNAYVSKLLPSCDLKNVEGY